MVSSQRVSCGERADRTSGTPCDGHDGDKISVRAGIVSRTCSAAIQDGRRDWLRAELIVRAKVCKDPPTMREGSGRRLP